MQARTAAFLLLLGVIVLLLALAACEGSCCYENPPGFRSHQEMLTAVASCANSQAAICREELPERREVWCRLNERECCALEPALAAQVFARDSEDPCGAATPVPSRTPTVPPPLPPPAPPSTTPTRTATPEVLVLPPVAILPKIVTPTFTPAPAAACLALPVLFDPPDGKSFAAQNSVFRWKPGCELGSDQVYDILVSTDGGKTSRSIGTTRDTNLPVDFLTWGFAGVTGNFSWTVRIRDASGKHVSCEGQWFAMTLTEVRGGPVGAPVPEEPCVPGYNVKCP